MTLPSSSKVLTLLIQSPPLLGSMAMQQTVCQVVDSLELRTPLQVDNLVHQMLELACKVGDSLLLIKRKGSQVVMVEAQSQNIVLGKMSKENCPGFETSSAVKESPKRKLQYSLSLMLQVGMIHDVGIIIVKMSSCVHIEIQLNTELISIFVVMYFLFR